MINNRLDNICCNAQTLNLKTARQAKQFANQNRNLYHLNAASFDVSPFAASLNEARQKTAEIHFTPSAATSLPLREELGQLLTAKPLPKRRQRR
jgi:hypothetical protein